MFIAVRFLRKLYRSYQLLLYILTSFLIKTDSNLCGQCRCCQGSYSRVGEKGNSQENDYHITFSCHLVPTLNFRFRKCERNGFWIGKVLDGQDNSFFCYVLVESIDDDRNKFYLFVEESDVFDVLKLLKHALHWWRFPSKMHFSHT